MCPSTWCSSTRRAASCASTRMPCRCPRPSSIRASKWPACWRYWPGKPAGAGCRWVIACCIRDWAGSIRPSFRPPGENKEKTVKGNGLKLAVAAALLGAGVAAQAGTDVGQWTLGAGALWHSPDADRRLDDALGFYADMGKALSEKWDLGVSLFQSNNDIWHAAGDHEI